jgi:hypothetical protein
MKLSRIILGIVALALASPAFGASRSGAPAKFSVPFGNSAGVAYINYPIPTPSQIGVKCGAASLTDGFPPLTMQAASAGGCPPLGQDFNGILKQITQWNQQGQMGAAPAYDGSFASSISGYPEGSILSQASVPSCLWISSADANSNNPDTGGANWTGTCPGGGIGGTSSGTNSQVITATPFSVVSLARVCWLAGGTNTGSLQINVNGAGLVNVYKRTQAGLVGLSSGEVHANQVNCADYDGTQYELAYNAAAADLVTADQSLNGGANVVSQNLGTGSGGGTVTIDCGSRPLQYITNNGNFTFAPPSNDGSCMVLITNGAAAGTVSFSSGFTVNSNTGEPFTTTNTNKFLVTIVRINGTSTWLNKALQ